MKKSKASTKSTTPDATPNTPAAPASVIESVVTPKPTKSEIIEAAAIREFEKRMADYRKQKDDHCKWLKEIERKVRDHVAKNIDYIVVKSSINTGWVNSGRDSLSNAYITFQLDDDILSPELIKELIKYNTRKCMVTPDYKDVLKEMRALFDSGSTRQERINTLLKSEASCKALDALVTELKEHTGAIAPAIQIAS